MITNLYFKSKLSALPFVPTDIAGCQLWLKADAGITKDGSDYVSQWADQSGNNNHAVQGTAISQPLLVNNAYNGKPTVRFDGADDYMEFPAGLLGGFNEITIVGVWKIAYEGNAGIFGTADYRQLEILTASGAQTCLRIGINDQMINKEVVMSGWFNNNILSTSVAAISSSAFSLELNDTPVSPYGGAQAMFPILAGAIYNIGRYAWNAGDFYSAMDLCDFIIYDRKITASEIQNINDYERTKYAHY